MLDMHRSAVMVYTRCHSTMRSEHRYRFEHNKSLPMQEYAKAVYN